MTRAARESFEVRALVFWAPETQPGDYENWIYPSPYLLQGSKNLIFAKGFWGGMFHDDLKDAPGQYRCNGALRIERLLEHRSRSPTQALWQGENYRHWLDS
jgi:hypothetical protein